MVRVETDKTASDIQARSFMARKNSGEECKKNAKLREKRKWPIEKTKAR